MTSDNYTAGFGMQWLRFRQTQLDSHSGLTLSSERFFRSAGCEPADLDGKLVLDVGCGAGRFTEIALEAGASVVALDYSEAVDACWLNHGHKERVLVIQADIYELPFAPATFDFVYCLGVLQHTPDPKRAFMCLPPQLRAGGRLVVDVYPWLLRNALWSKYWIRPLSKRLPPEQLFSAVQLLVRFGFPLSRMLGRVPWLGRKLRYALPMANYEGIIPLSTEQLWEWGVLDTFDMLAPAHDHPKSLQDLRSWFSEAGMQSVEVFRDGQNIGRGNR